MAWISGRSAGIAGWIFITAALLYVILRPRGSNRLAKAAKIIPSRHIPC
jgi:hypothetical protein